MYGKKYPLRKCTAFSIFLLLLTTPAITTAKTIYVDDDNPADFNNIQAAINNTNDGDTIIVAEGIYYENINFKGKNIALRSTDPNNPDIVSVTIIDGNNLDSVVTFAGTENATCVLSGFTIQNGAQDGDPYIKGGGGMCGGSETNHTHATIRNNIITHNFAWDGGGLSRCDGLIEKNIVTNNYARWWQGGGGLYLCNGIIRNNIIAANNANGCESAGALSYCDGTIENNTITQNFSYGVGVVAYCRGTIRNCIIWGNTPDGNIDTDPCFADPNNGDYHLKSQAGRWNANEGRWTKDDVTSLCIDAGDPASPIGLEPFPNGGIINMGAYGGTAEASKSYFGEPVCETIVAGDINGDCKVDFKDFAIMAYHWLWENKSPVEIPEFYYYVGGGKIYLDLYPELITVCFEEFVEEEEKVALIEADPVLEEIYRELSPFGIVLVSTKIGSNELDVLQTIERLNKLPQIKYSTPVFGYFEHLIGISDEFIAKFYPNITREEIEAFNALNNVEIARKTEWVDWYVLRVKNPKVISALEMANLYYEDPITEYAEPNFWVSMPWP
ncbi:MAG: right-handed parallel beta-helix repeat-containing protein [Planctomycetota bacterium]|nr:right-handed parallel beta-helix repeat-containing protein [Planctomycetota bacterium]